MYDAMTHGDPERQLMSMDIRMPSPPLPPPCLSGGRYSRSLRCLGLLPTQNLRGKDRVTESLEMQVIERPAFDQGFDHAVDAAAHHALVGAGLVARRRSEVGDAADRGIFQSLFDADLAEGRVAERDADAESQRVSAVAPAHRQFADDVAHLDRH